MPEAPLKDHSIYLPLPADGVSVRLVTIHPSPVTRKSVKCTVRFANLEKKPEYEALSYCWGDPTITEEICVNGASLRITANLASALRALRLADEPRTVWADAICIDQTNIAEKAVQVPLMRQIYASSTGVVVWLGEADAVSDRAMNFMRKLAMKYAEERRSNFKGIEKLKGTSTPQISLYLTGLKRGLVEEDRSYETWKSYQATDALLRRPWFRRTWIVQEVAVAPSVSVICGNQSLEWDQFVAAIELKGMLMGENFQEVMPVALSYHLQLISASREQIRKGDFLSLRDALRRFQPFEATKPVDKIFGLRALLAHPESVVVDYDTPVRRVYQNAAATIIKDSRNLDLLLDCHPITTGPRLPGLPSWVPDWSASDEIRSHALNTVFAQDPFSASLGMATHARFSSGNCCLQVDGLIVDTITLLGRRLSMSEDPTSKYWPKGRWIPKISAYEVILHGLDVIRDWKTVASPGETTDEISARYPTGETYRDVFWQVSFLTLDPTTNDAAAKKWRHSLRAFDNLIQWWTWMELKGLRRAHWLFVCLIAFSWFAVVCVIAIAIGGLVSFNPDRPGALDGSSQAEKVIGRTATGLIGMVPAGSKVGDRITIFKGGKRPFVVRAVGEKWRLVGDSYVHGVMYGGAFDEAKCKMFWIV
ncbi:hypothetical protein W97_06731 [Coniosporium apollinis CBS 100218]|uniref:Heterokaryon incompatibility domain-containing protein n=1 Tax=Coniosporium apollinis (strain CBS 100218) TaxID=1168221 RepID=R7YZZ9_CONA1|nr:uncharacterized protein W97_06731 [Coniosporium apollinis CBS 100218]EON67477.1 hypothetical protein W97_06731 [Coniosporium apollinis CBS 100218]